MTARASHAALSIVALLAMGIASLGVSQPGHVSLSHAEEVALAPTPTPAYISNLAPAAVRAPIEPAALPSSGAGFTPRTVWPTAAGVGLAMLGALMVYASLAFRPTRSR